MKQMLLYPPWCVTGWTQTFPMLVRPGHWRGYRRIFLANSSADPAKARIHPPLHKPRWHFHTSFLRSPKIKKKYWRKNVLLVKLQRYFIFFHLFSPDDSRLKEGHFLVEYLSVLTDWQPDFVPSTFVLFGRVVGHAHVIPIWPLQLVSAFGPDPLEKAVSGLVPVSVCQSIPTKPTVKG